MCSQIVFARLLGGLMVGVFVCPAPAISSTDPIFADGFEAQVTLVPFTVPSSMTCDIGSSLTATQGTPIRVCYRLINRTDTRAFTHQHIQDNVLGVTYDHDLLLAAGANIVVESDVAPFPIEDNGNHFVDWVASAGNSIAKDSQIQFFGYDPNIKLHALIVENAADCAQGIVNPVLGYPFLSGLTSVTVAPGTSLTGCYRAKNEGGQLLDTHRLADTSLGTLLDVHGMTLGQGGIYSLPRVLPTPATVTFGATWYAGFGVDASTWSTDEATVHVIADPACSGGATSSTIDYAGIFGSVPPDNLTSSGMRLDFDVAASALRVGDITHITAEGTMVSLPNVFGGVFFGPRDDTRVTLAIPPGISTSQPIHVTGTMNGSLALSATVDVPNRLIILNTGPVSGPPASIRLTIDATPDGTADPVVFVAPQLELDLHLGDIPFALGGLPDPGAPPVLSAGLCTH